MLTLKDFLENICFYEHYRVFSPNRDCLIFESYFEHHSHYRFDEGNEGAWLNLNDAYYKDNHFSDKVRKTREFDEETKLFIKKYGKYRIFRMETGQFYPVDMSYGTLFGDPPKFKLISPNPILCFNIYILPPVK